MQKALRANAPLPYSHLVTLFLKHFKVPLTNEPSFKVKRSFTIGAVVLLLLVIRKILMDNRDPSFALLNDVLNEIQDLHAFVGERFDSMHCHITRLKDDMGFIHRCFDPPTDP